MLNILGGNPASVARKNVGGGSFWDTHTPLTYFKCEENAATTVVVDSGSGSTNGVSTGNTSTLSVAGKNNLGFDLNGSSELIDMGQTYQSTFRSSFSIPMWIKPTDGQPAGDGYILGAFETTGALYFQQFANGTLYFLLRDGTATSVDCTSSVVFADGATAWTHVMLVYNAATDMMYIYANGVEVASVDSSTIDMSGFTTAKNLYIGRRNYTSTTWYAGSVDEVSVLAEALTADDAVALYNGGDGDFLE